MPALANRGAVCRHGGHVSVTSSQEASDSVLVERDRKLVIPSDAAGLSRRLAAAATTPSSSSAQAGRNPALPEPASIYNKLGDYDARIRSGATNFNNYHLVERFSAQHPGPAGVQPGIERQRTCERASSLDVPTTSKYAGTCTHASCSRRTIGATASRYQRGLGHRLAVRGAIQPPTKPRSPSRWVATRSTAATSTSRISMRSIPASSPRPSDRFRLWRPLRPPDRSKEPHGPSRNVFRRRDHVRIAVPSAHAAALRGILRRREHLGRGESCAHVARTGERFGVRAGLHLRVRVARCLRGGFRRIPDALSEPA